MTLRLHPAEKIPGIFSFGGGPFDLASNWKNPGIVPFGTRKKVQIPSRKKVHPSRSNKKQVHPSSSNTQKKYTQAGATNTDSGQQKVRFPRK